MSGVGGQAPRNAAATSAAMSEKREAGHSSSNPLPSLLQVEEDLKGKSYFEITMWLFQQMAERPSADDVLMRAVNYVLGEGSAKRKRNARQRAADAKSLSMLKDRNPGFVRGLMMAKAARRLEAGEEYMARGAEDGIKAKKFLVAVLTGEERFRDHDDMLAKIKSADILIKSADKVYAPTQNAGRITDGEDLTNARVIDVRLPVDLERGARPPVAVVEAERGTL